MNYFNTFYWMKACFLHCQQSLRARASVAGHTGTRLTRTITRRGAPSTAASSASIAASSAAPIPAAERCLEKLTPSAQPGLSFRITCEY